MDWPTVLNIGGYVVGLVGVPGGIYGLFQLFFGEKRAKKADVDSEIGRLEKKVEVHDNRIDELEAENEHWRDKAWQWYQKYQMFRLKVAECMVQKGMSLEDIKQLLGETEEWLP